LPIGAGFCQQRLFKDKFVCAVRADHPRVRDALTLAQFQNELHLAIATSGTGHRVFERALEEQKIQRRIAVTVPSFLGISSILTATDFIVTLPGQLGEYLANSGNIKTLPLPFEMPTFFITQHWHELNGHDAANKWLRSLMAELFLVSERPIQIRAEGAETGKAPVLRRNWSAAAGAPAVR
jgi:DNA-binding transcriptional LysR family regulator